MIKKIVTSTFIIILFLANIFAQTTTFEPPTNKVININGVFPNLSVLGSSDKERSESGIGGLIPWADKLWMIGYVAHIKGSGLGLYEISDDMTMVKHPQGVTGTYANRMIHNDSEQAIIGPHFIDKEGTVRTSKELSKHRLAATMEHLNDPTNKVYFLTMEGLFYECDVRTLDITLLFNLFNELEIPETGYVHFKDGHTGNGRVVVAIWGSRKECAWSKIFPIVDKRVKTDVCPMFFHLGENQTLKYYFENAGFRDVKLHRIKTKLTYQSAKEACDASFLGGPVAMAYSRFDDLSKKEARKEYTAYIEQYKVKKGYEIPGEFVIGIGRKEP